MASAFNCPTCGAPLHTDGNETNIQCEYCGASVIVPPELRAQAAQPVAAAYQASAAGNPAQRRAQLRQMMQLIRDGRMEDAAALLTSATGAPAESSRQTVEMISRSLAGSGRIDPMALMGILGQSTHSAGYWEPYNPGQGSQVPNQPVRSTRRRGSGLGCLILIVLIGLAIYATSNPFRFVGMVAALWNGSQNGSLQKTAAAPAADIQTQVAPLLKTAGVSEGSNAVVMSFGGDGIGQGLMKDSRSVAIDGEGRIYTADYTGGRVQVFSRQGEYLAEWLVDAKMPLRSLVVDRSGKVYIVQGSKINIYDGMSGKLIKNLPVAGESGFDDLFITPTGKIAAAEFSAQDRVVFFDPDGKVEFAIPQPFTNATGNSEPLMRVAVDGLGNIYLAGVTSSVILKFGPDGKFINRFGSRGSQPGQFLAIQAIAVDGQGQVYVSDVNGILVFAPDGRYLKTIKLPEGVPFGMVFASNGNLLVTNRNMVYELAVK